MQGGVLLPTPFLDISDQYDALGGDKLLQSFVEAGSVDGKKFALPYYFGSRYMFMRKDVWKEAGVNTPTTLDEFNAARRAAEGSTEQFEQFQARLRVAESTVAAVAQELKSSVSGFKL